MKKNLITSVLMTIVTTLLLGIIYPLVVTGLAQLFFKDKANGQLIVQNGKIIGSRIIGQAFVGPSYFHSRPSAAGSGYDGAAYVVPFWSTKTMPRRTDTEELRAT